MPDLNINDLESSITSGNIREIEELIKKKKKDLKATSLDKIKSHVNELCKNNYCTKMEYLDLVKKAIIPHDNYMAALRIMAPNGINVYKTKTNKVENEERTIIERGDLIGKWSKSGVNARMPDELCCPLKEKEEEVLKVKPDLNITLGKAFFHVDEVLADLKAIKVIDILDEDSEIDDEGTKQYTVGDFNSEAKGVQKEKEINTDNKVIRSAEKFGKSVMSDKKVDVEVKTR